MKRSTIGMFAILFYSACTPAGTQVQKDRELASTPNLESKGHDKSTASDKSDTRQTNLEPKEPVIGIEKVDDQIAVKSIVRADGKPYQKDEVTISISPVTNPKIPLVSDVELYDSIAVEEAVTISVTDNHTGKVIVSKTVSPDPEEPDIEIDEQKNAILIANKYSDFDINVLVLSNEGEIETLTALDGELSIQSIDQSNTNVIVDGDKTILEVEVFLKNNEGGFSTAEISTTKQISEEVSSETTKNHELVKVYELQIKELKKKRKLMKKSRNILQSELVKMKDHIKNLSHLNDKSKVSSKDKESSRKEPAKTESKLLEWERLQQSIDTAQANLFSIIDQIRDISAQLKVVRKDHRDARQKWKKSFEKNH